MGLVLLTAQEIGERHNALINTDWLAFAYVEVSQTDLNDLTLMFVWGIPARLVGVGGTSNAFQPHRSGYHNCPDPEAVLAKILAAV